MIQVFTPEDISKLSQLQPPDWRDVRPVFRQFISQPWFYPYKIEQEGKLLAVGEGILHGSSAWIGNVIVAPQHRRQGLGMKVTRFLRDRLEEKGARSQFLLATEMGKGLYEKLGFRTESRQIFFELPDTFSQKEGTRHESIKDMEPRDLPDVIRLDTEVTGEHRGHLIQDFWKGGKIIRSGEGALSAFYLPGLGEGLVLARNHSDGMRMLQFRLQEGPPVLVVPEQQQQLIDWMRGQGFQSFRVAYRMVYGESILWKPESVFSRIGGYLG